MGKKGGSVAVPDPAATAQAQSVANKETAISQAGLNSTNQVTPYGNLTYSQIGTWSDGTPRFQATTTLDPTQQSILNQQNALDLGTSTLGNQQLGRIQANLSTPFSYAGLPAAPQADSGARQQVIDALMSQAHSRLDPQFKQQEDALKTDLANRGIAMDSTAYSRAMDDFNRNKTDAYQTADNQAVAAGGSEQSRLFDIGQQARQQGIQEYTTQRNAPLNEASALMSGTQIQNPNFVNSPQTSVQPTDVIGATNMATNVALQNNQNRTNQLSSIYGALGGLGGAGLYGYLNRG